jgi:protein-S-isoprenylcysteine O-methyltransferase Ste14
MQRHLAARATLALIVMVLTRVVVMSRRGIRARYFGAVDRKDFLIPPFALFYLYLVFAGAFVLPYPGGQIFFRSGAVAWIGVLLCPAGLVLVILSLAALGRSFRVGIDARHPGELVTSGVFRWTRNPIYAALGASSQAGFGVLELDSARLRGSWHVAVSSTGAPRGGIPRLLSPRQAIPPGRCSPARPPRADPTQRTSRPPEPRGGAAIPVR